MKIPQSKSCKDSKTSENISISSYNLSPTPLTSLSISKRKWEKFPHTHFNDPMINKFSLIQHEAKILFLAMKDGNGEESRALNIIRKMGNYEESELNFPSTFAVVSSPFEAPDDGLGECSGKDNKQIRLVAVFVAE